jgi:hypothetical protein
MNHKKPNREAGEKKIRYGLRGVSELKFGMDTPSFGRESAFAIVASSDPLLPKQIRLFMESC